MIANDWAGHALDLVTSAYTITHLYTVIIECNVDMARQPAHAD